MKRVTTLSLVVALALLISACNFPFVDTESAMATSVAATVDAMEESHVVKPTLAPLPTQAPPEPVAPTATAEDIKDDERIEEKLPQDQCLWATFISETIPDGTNFSTGESFTKTWTLRNDGYCDWNDEYHLVFKSGTQMDGPDDYVFGIEIDPGEEITLSLDLTAPSTAGTYTGYWQLETNKDAKFGSALSVKIDVE
ncbi:MAG: hypothetical protein PWQ55_1483 [Chloroflexota bacterium]|nr:hypothetical protein [Chloroflexota bacterium]